MAQRMGLDFGLEKSTVCVKRKFRWLFRIDGVSASGINSLPPAKAARPNLTFKEAEVQHLNETVYYPTKPEWKPITLVLYDLKKQRNPVFNWFKKVYNSCNGEFKPSVGNDFKVSAYLEMFSGCGDVLESWKFENAWPQVIEFGELDMGSSDYNTIEVTLRYDRATIIEEC